ncbi:MAG: DUF4493 domain-containing protein [Rikenellaceae bacterium]
MRKILQRVISLAAAAAFLLTVASSCDGTDANFNTPDNVIEPSDIIDPYSNGYISFSNVALSVEIEDENFNDNKSGEYEASNKVASRADESTDENTDESTDESTDDSTDESSTIDTGSFIVTLTQESTGTVVYDKTYAEVLQESDLLTLSAGYYTLYVTSDRVISSTAWGKQVYASSQTRLVVGDENVTSLGSIVCRLATIKSQVTLAADMKALFDTSDSAATPLTVTLTYGDEALTYDLDKLYSTDKTDDENAANAGYFAPQDGVNSIVVTLEGMYNSAAANDSANYIPINWTQTITNVKAGQSRMISIKFDNYDSGNIQITLEVQEWIYESALGVDIFTQSFALSLSEDKLFDPDSQTSDVGAPVLSFISGCSSADDIYEITEYTFNEASETYSPIYCAMLTPESGSTVKSASVIVSSTNGLFISAIEEAGYDDYTIDIFGGSASTNGSSSYVSALENSMTSELTLTLKYSAIRALYNYSGTHTFTLVVTDSENRTSYTNLTIEVVSTAGPTILWDGGEFGVYQEITTAEALNVVLKISSNSGIESLKIKFTSPVLTVDMLEALSLAEEIDIAQTATTAMADRLTELGIPSDKAVYGKTYLEVDISTFMPLLAELPYTQPAAYTDFQITAADANGETIETLMVVRYYTDAEIANNSK